jgi:hypothetical protein
VADGSKMEGSIELNRSATIDFSFSSDGTILKFECDVGLQTCEWDIATQILKSKSAGDNHDNGTAFPPSRGVVRSLIDGGKNLESLNYFSTTSARGQPCRELQAISTVHIMHNSVGYNPWKGTKWPCHNQFGVKGRWIVDAEGKWHFWLPLRSLIHENILVYGGRRLVLVAEGLHILDIC